MEFSSFIFHATIANEYNRETLRNTKLALSCDYEQRQPWKWKKTEGNDRRAYLRVEREGKRERERCQQEDKLRVTDESVSITWSIVFAESMMSSRFSVNNYSPTFRVSSFCSPSMTRVSLIRYVRDDNRKKYAISRHRRSVVTRLSIFIDLIDNKTGKDATTIKGLFVIVGSRFASIHRVLFSRAAHGQSRTSAIFVLPHNFLCYGEFPLSEQSVTRGTKIYASLQRLKLVASKT